MGLEDSWPLPEIEYDIDNATLLVRGLEQAASMIKDEAELNRSGHAAVALEKVLIHFQSMCRMFPKWKITLPVRDPGFDVFDTFRTYYFDTFGDEAEVRFTNEYPRAHEVLKNFDGMQFKDLDVQVLKDSYSEDSPEGIYIRLYVENSTIEVSSFIAQLTALLNEERSRTNASPEAISALLEKLDEIMSNLPVIEQRLGSHLAIRRVVKVPRKTEEPAKKNGNGGKAS